MEIWTNEVCDIDSCSSIFLWLYNNNYCPILYSGLRFPCYNHLWRLPTPVSHGFAWIFLGFHATLLVLSCSLVWDLWYISLWSIDWPKYNHNLSYHFCLKYSHLSGVSNFHWSPLQCSQNSDHHFCLTTPLRTRQICHSDNPSAKFQPLPSFHAQSGTSVSTPGFRTHIFSLSRSSPIDFFKSSSPLFHGLLTPESRTVTLIHQFLTLVTRRWDT